MRIQVIAILLWITSLSAYGQEFNTHWIYAPQADSTSHFWFRHAYIMQGRPHQASIKVTTTGYYKLYINECNVGRAVFYPFRPDNDSDVVEMTFDISPYLRKDTNVIAILYSPTLPSVSHRQIAVNFYGKAKNGTDFCYTSDESWTCRPANSSLTGNGGELIDRRAYDTSWKAATISNLALWQPAESYHPANKQPVRSSHESLSATHITLWEQTDISKDPNLIRPDYGFYGFVRATIRDARRGERLQFGNLQYICSGETDEQAYPQFGAAYLDSISIIGRSNKITTLEAIELNTK